MPEYEDAYDRAVHSARFNYPNVSGPYIGADGKRRCDVNGKARTDHQMFELVWGSEEAERICKLLAG